MSIHQLNFEGLDKVEVALKLLQEREPPEDYYGAGSGGKDSEVIIDLSKLAKVKVDWHYCVSPTDPPQVHQFLKEKHPEIQWDYHARGFWKMVVKKGLPLRQSRWCCQVIKEAGGIGRTVILGSRAEEGTIRKHQLPFERHRTQPKTFVRPILYWTEGEVWEYIREHNLPYCKLYDEGFHRLGCVLCPFSREIKRELEYFPKIAYLWRRACDHIVENRLTSGKQYNRPFTTGQELWNWWIARD